MKPGKIKLVFYFFVLSSLLSLKAEDKILSAPIINLEKLKPSYENLENDKETISKTNTSIKNYISNAAIEATTHIMINNLSMEKKSDLIDSSIAELNNALKN